MHLCKNASLTYEMLNLFISKLNYNDLIIQDRYGFTPLMELSSNSSITYEMLELFIF